MTPEERLKQLEEALSNALSNPQNNSLEKVKVELKAQEEFKNFDINSFLAPGGVRIWECMVWKPSHTVLERVQTIIIDETHRRELLKQGLSPKEILMKY